MEHAPTQRDVVFLPLQLEDLLAQLVVGERGEVGLGIVVVVGQRAGALEDRPLERRQASRPRASLPRPGRAAGSRAPRGGRRSACGAPCASRRWRPPRPRPRAAGARARRRRLLRDRGTGPLCWSPLLGTKHRFKQPSSRGVNLSLRLAPLFVPEARLPPRSRSPRPRPRPRALRRAPRSRPPRRHGRTARRGRAAPAPSRARRTP